MKFSLEPLHGVHIDQAPSPTRPIPLQCRPGPPRPVGPTRAIEWFTKEVATIFTNSNRKCGWAAIIHDHLSRTIWNLNRWFWCHSYQLSLHVEGASLIHMLQNLSTSHASPCKSIQMAGPTRSTHKIENPNSPLMRHQNHGYSPKKGKATHSTTIICYTLHQTNPNSHISLYLHYIPPQKNRKFSFET